MQKSHIRKFRFSSLRTGSRLGLGRDNEQTDDNYMLEETILHNAGVLQALILPWKGKGETEEKQLITTRVFIFGHPSKH